MTDGIADRREPVLVREGGVRFTPVHERDPLEAWVDLMEAVEALCPRWPARTPTWSGGFRL